jgi:CelD/BcsL family acetyltransferase involved in cellulose biosynthesis
MNMERIRDFSDFKKLHDEWNSLLHISGQDCIFLTHEWFVSWWANFSEGSSLEIVIFRDEDRQLIGIAPFMKKKRTLRFLASHEVSDYCDVIAATGREKELYETLINYLRTDFPNIKKIELMNLKSSSPTLHLMHHLAQKHNFSSTCYETEVAPVLSLPLSYKRYLETLNRKQRHELRRKLRKVESLQGVEIKKITDAEELYSALDLFVDLHKRSSHLKAKFWEKQGISGFFHEVVNRFAKNNWIELVFLFHQDKIMAALLNFTYLNTIYFYNVAFNRDFSWCSPGFFLFNHSIKEAISKKVRHADFLRGQEKYKYSFGAKESKIFQLNLTSRVVEI